MLSLAEATLQSFMIETLGYAQDDKRS